MADAPFYMKRGDTEPKLLAQFRQGDGNILDLTGATVVFTMTKRGSTTPKISLSSVDVVDAALGTVSYTWTTGDTDTTGTYDAEFKVSFIGGRISAKCRPS